MSNVININFQDTIISQWEEAVDKSQLKRLLLSNTSMETKKILTTTYSQGMGCG